MSDTDSSTTRVGEVQNFSLQDLKSFAEDFANDHLLDYANYIQSCDKQFSRKEINDPLWGTISLAPVEVALLDTPLIQRLRYIRQLGVVHWIYPGAGHTRFEHTIGSLHQVQTLASAINDLSLQHGSGPVIEQSQLQTLRIAALLHDCGHGAFSHVCEQALSILPDVEQVATQFAKDNRIERRQLSEMMAFFIVRSNAMKEFLRVIWPRCPDLITLGGGTAANIDNLSDKVARAITGQMIDEKLPLLHELISGPFDADKLDYYARDAHMSGTPSLLDISRLIQKITIREVSQNDLPPEIAKRVQKSDKPHWLFGIRWSGIAVLDELHLARVLLYAKIYRHPKVVAIEQMLKAFVAAMLPVSSAKLLVKFFYSLEDDAILHLEPERLQNLALPEYSGGELAGRRVHLAHVQLQKIRTRRLVIKSFQLHERYPADELEHDEIQRAGLNEFAEDLSHPERSKPLVERIRREVCKILEVLGADGPGFKELDEIETEVLVHVQSKQSGGAQIGRAYLMPKSGPPMPFREYTVNRHGWADSYSSDQPLGYVFASPELANCAFLAVEKIARTEFGVRLPTAAVELAKRDGNGLQAIKRTLSDRGYYQGTPFDIRPNAQILTTAGIHQAIQQFEKKLAAYQEPQIAEPTITKPALYQKIFNWLKQFETDEHIECAAMVLNNFRMLTREDTVSALRAFVAQNQKFIGATVVPFGDAKDSGAIQGYFASDLLGREISRVCSIEDAVKKYAAKQIIFVDDFIASGGQATDILAAGFGVEALRKALGEQRDMFGDDVREHLLRCEVGFVFTAGWDDGVEAVRQIANELKLNAVVFRHLDEKSLPFAFDTSFETQAPEVIASFRDRCREIGRQLIKGLEQDDQKLDDQKIDQRALGYGNRAMLLASPFNVPAQTLTAIWAAGRVDDADWKPLIPRRKKT
jgi:HD superfamily phosphohydrolase